MARETKTIEVSGRQYQIKHMPGTAARRLFHRLVRTAGPTLKTNIEQIVEVMTAEEKIGEAAAAAKLSGLFLDIVGAIPPDLEEALFSAFIPQCKWLNDGIPVDMIEEIFDDHFAGDVLGQDAWLIQCMKHNFLGFLSSERKPPS